MNKIEIIKLKEERDRLLAALNYIASLTGGDHLGRPRLSDKTCVFCMTYFALHDGAFGESISKQDYEKLLKNHE